MPHPAAAPSRMRPVGPGSPPNVPRCGAQARPSSCIRHRPAPAGVVRTGRAGAGSPWARWLGLGHGRRPGSANRSHGPTRRPSLNGKARATTRGGPSNRLGWAWSSETGMIGAWCEPRMQPATAYGKVNDSASTPWRCVMMSDTRKLYRVLRQDRSELRLRHGRRHAIDTSGWPLRESDRLHCRVLVVPAGLAVAPREQEPGEWIAAGETRVAFEPGYQ